MEKKNILHTEQIYLKNRTYFLDIKVSEAGKQFLTLTQVEDQEDGSSNRQRLVLFEEDLLRLSERLVRTLLYFHPSDLMADKAYVDQERANHANAFRRWTRADENLLAELYQQGHEIPELMEHFKRNERAIIKRLETMGIAMKASA